MLNVSQSTCSKAPIFIIYMDTLTNFPLSGKNLQLEPLGKKYSDLIEKLAPKIMSSSFLKSTFEVTQTTKWCNGRMKYLKLDNFRSTPRMIYSYFKHIFLEVLFSLARQWYYLKPVKTELTIKWLLFFECVSWSRILRTNRKKIFSWCHWRRNIPI